MWQVFEAVARCKLSQSVREVLITCCADVNIKEGYIQDLKQRCPELQKVDFVAVGSGADSQQMMALAASAGGTFFEAGSNI